MKNHIKKIIYAFIFITMLSAFYTTYQTVRPTVIVWDKHDPKLHGQDIFFNAPMAYLEVDQITFFGQLITTETDLFLTNLDDAKHMQAEGGERGIREGVKNIIFLKHPMKFKIVDSFWKRKNWIRRGGLNSDSRRLYIEDQSGVKSVALFSLLINSNKPKLSDLNEEGRFDLWFIKVLSWFRKPEKTN